MPSHSITMYRSYHKHPQFAHPSTRTKTMRHIHPRYAPRLVDAGFFYWARHKTYNCFSCGLVLLNIPDDPFIDHARLNPECPHLITAKGQTYVNRVFAAYPKASKPWEAMFI
jgi:hypothetical protein